MNYIVVRINQKQNAVIEEIGIRSFLSAKNIAADAVFYDDSLQKDELGARKNFLSFLQNLKENDTIVVATIETLGWRVGELVQIIAKIFDKKCEIICAHDDERLHPQMPAEMLISKLGRTRAQNIKMGRSKLGRPEGSRSKSKYDAHLPSIMEFLKTSRNISALARELGISRTSLKDYIASRGL